MLRWLETLQLHDFHSTQQRLDEEERDSLNKQEESITTAACEDTCSDDGQNVVNVVSSKVTTEQIKFRLLQTYLGTITQKLKLYYVYYFSNILYPKFL